MSETTLTLVAALTGEAITNLEAKLMQATDEGNLWFDLICAIIEENKDDTLLRRALDTVEQQKSA